MLTLSEYKQKKSAVAKEIIKILSDDSSEFTTYQLCYHNSHDGICNPLGIFKKYKNLKAKMAEQIEFCEFDCISKDEKGVNSADYNYFAINKYKLIDGEYTEEMSCRLSSGGDLLPSLPEQYDVLAGLDIPVSRDVLKAYETGDILIVNAAPLSEPYYIIYAYDEKRKGNKHLQLCFEKGKFNFYKIQWLELIEKVDSCPIQEINDMSKRIKDNPAKFEKLLENQKVLYDIKPM